eukprot:GHVS01101262.1.p2 GENE.GHVS01101262.1~~GHVS01101262.1.p2  ORF type:complete len:155 (-),score=5.75 GHVS01101262.1:7-471(-)
MCETMSLAATASAERRSKPRSNTRRSPPSHSKSAADLLLPCQRQNITSDIDNSRSPLMGHFLFPSTLFSLVPRNQTNKGKCSCKQELEIVHIVATPIDSTSSCYRQIKGNVHFIPPTISVPTNSYTTVSSALPQRPRQKTPTIQKSMHRHRFDD